MRILTRICKLRKKNEKIPPITIVGATNFSIAMDILNASAIINYTIKYMSIGIKIMIENSDAYIKFKSNLKAAKVQFFSHDLSSEKLDKFVLSGIAKTPINEIEQALIDYQLEPIEIREIDQKKQKVQR